MYVESSGSLWSWGVGRALLGILGSRAAGHRAQGFGFRDDDLGMASAVGLGLHLWEQMPCMSHESFLAL